MKVWFYCSYSGSPVGFQLGYVDTESLSEGENRLVAGTPHPLLNRCLSYQGVKEAFGKIPATNSYVAVRPISRLEGDRVYLNFAFETDSAIEFASIVQYMDTYRTHDRDLFDIMLPTVIEDTRDSSFGIHVNGRELQKVIRGMLQPPASAPWKGEFYVRTKDPEQGEALAENLRLAKIYRDAAPAVLPDTERESTWSVIREKGELARIEQEGVSSPFPGRKAVIIAVAVLFLILIAFMILMNRKPTAGESQNAEQSEVVQNPNSADLENQEEESKPPEQTKT
ncbi:MAG: hypothetical protein IJQ81_09830 [Oscillibacter sp.]|nr:hypothetical protein [Oscillibacter sp.]